MIYMYKEVQWTLYSPSTEGCKTEMAVVHDDYGTEQKQCIQLPCHYYSCCSNFRVFTNPSTRVVLKQTNMHASLLLHHQPSLSSLQSHGPSILTLSWQQFSSNAPNKWRWLQTNKATDTGYQQQYLGSHRDEVMTHTVMWGSNTSYVLCNNTSHKQSYIKIQWK